MEITATLAENKLAHKGMKFLALNVPTHSVPISLTSLRKTPAVPKDLGT